MHVFKFFENIQFKPNLNLYYIVYPMSLSHIKNTTIARIVETVYCDVTYNTFLIR